MRFLLALACLLFVIALGLAAYEVFILGDESAADENSQLEIIQSLFALVSGFIFLGAALVIRGRRGLIFTFCALLCVNFFFREVNFELYDVSPFIVFMGNGGGRNAVLFTGYFLILGYAVLHFKAYFKESVTFLASKSAKLLILGGIMLLVSSFFEKAHSVPHNQFIEESFELVGYLAVSYASLYALDHALITARERKSQHKP